MTMEQVDDLLEGPTELEVPQLPQRTQAPPQPRHRRSRQGTRRGGG